ncbi:hypothetical protein BDQ17DRAFT_1324293 [Cyathus striatus]|nr:hypothetical protein BDQ17DRAFT_1324293 [Cyathus striatus]
MMHEICTCEMFGCASKMNPFLRCSKNLRSRILIFANLTMVIELSIYASRELRMEGGMGPPVLCDLGEARFGERTYVDEYFQPSVPTPEVMLGEAHVHKKRQVNGEFMRLYRLAEVVAVMGPPPLNYLARSVSGNKITELVSMMPDWKRADEAPIHANMFLESSEKQLKGETRHCSCNSLVK